MAEHLSRLWTDTLRNQKRAVETKKGQANEKEKETEYLSRLWTDTLRKQNTKREEREQIKIERGKQSTCHVFGQTHSERKRNKSPRGRHVKEKGESQVEREALVMQCSKRNSDLSRLWTDTLCEN